MSQMGKSKVKIQILEYFKSIAQNVYHSRFDCKQISLAEMYLPLRYKFLCLLLLFMSLFKSPRLVT